MLSRLYNLFKIQEIRYIKTGDDRGYNWAAGQDSNSKIEAGYIIRRFKKKLYPNQTKTEFYAFQLAGRIETVPVADCSPAKDGVLEYRY